MSPTTPSESSHLSADLLLETARRGTLLPPVLETHLEGCPHCQLQLEGLRTGLLWLRTYHPVHRAHAHLISEDRLGEWMADRLEPGLAREVDALIASCSVCRLLAEQAGLELMDLHVAVPAEKLARVTSQHLLEELHGWSPAGTRSGEEGSSTTTIHPPPTGSGVEGLEDGGPASASPGSRPPSPWQRLVDALRAWWTGLPGWASQLAPVMLLLLIATPLVKYWLATREASDGGTVSGTVARSKSTTSSLAIELSADVLEPNASGDTEVTQRISSEGTEQGSCSTRAELRFRVSAHGLGVLSLWHVSPSGARLVQQWTADRYGGEWKALLEPSGARLQVPLVDNRGWQTFVAVLSDAPPPLDGQVPWLERVMSEAEAETAFARVSCSVP